MEELEPKDLAAALEVPKRTVQSWLKTGALPGRQKVTGRWVTTVGQARAFIIGRGYGAEDGVRMLDAYVVANHSKRGSERSMTLSA